MLPLRFLLAALVVLLFACGERATPTDPGAPAGPEVPASVLAWLEQHAIPFRTAEPGGDASDLAVLQEMIGDARAVALGEATHGTREFFQMKHRVLEYLVKEMGFTVFGIEATWAESNDVNRYVHTGEGNPAALLSNLYFWTWNTQEVLDMIHWMREHNAGAPPGSRVSFRGFDMQFSGRAMDDVLSFAAQVGGAASGVVGQGYVCWRTWHSSQSYRAAPARSREECRAGVRGVYDYLAERREAFEAATSPAAFAHALRAARVVVQHEHLAAWDWFGLEPNPRERYMAENAEWLLEQAGPDAKIVLWAHNAHVWYVVPYMGAYLKSTFGSDMVSVGFSFAHGRFNAVTRQGGQFLGLDVHNGGVPRSGSYEHAFDELEADRFLLDLRPLRAGSPEAAAWLQGPRLHRLIGAAYDPQTPHTFYASVRLPTVYDVLIHFRDTQPSVLLPFVP
jgi:erythromycin esterase